MTEEINKTSPGDTTPTPGNEPLDTNEQVGQASIKVRPKNIAMAVPHTGGQINEGHVYVNPFIVGEVNDGEQPSVAATGITTTQEAALALLSSVEADDHGELNQSKLLLGLSLLDGAGGEVYQELLNKMKGSQYLNVDDRKIGCNTVSPPLQGGKLVGRQAVNQIKSRTNSSVEKIQRLPKSGFNVIIGYISERSKLGLQHKLLNLVHDVGIATNGLLLSYDDAHVQVAITDFVLDHVVNCSVDGWDREYLANNLLVADLPMLHTAALAAIYPRGYPFFRSCVYRDLDTDKCDWTSVAKELDDINNMTRMDFGFVGNIKGHLMTHEMRLQLAAAPNTTTKKQVAEYQAASNPEVLVGPFKTTKETSYHFNTVNPSFSKYKRESRLWIDEVTNLVDGILMAQPLLSEEEDMTRRRNTYNEFLDKSRMEYFSSYVKSVVETDLESGEKSYFSGEDDNDVLVMFEILGSWAGDDDAVDTATRLLAEHSFESQWGFTAIPDYKCPTCNRGQRTPVDTLEGFIFFNVTNYFFELMKKVMS